MKEKTKSTKITIIGAGNMGGAIARGLAKGSIFAENEITCTAAGKATYTCALCGDTYSETIPETFGYNEDIIKNLSDRGFKIALIHKIVNFPTTEYLKDIDRIVKEYDVEYFNIKESSQDKYDKNDKNYK